jgi:hypothetical protein
MRYARILAMAIATTMLVAGSTTPARADVSFGFFYSNLEPHGTWHVSAQYGRVWQPAVYSVQWNPYYDGHWVYTDVGWAWVSDYPWGAIPYHYGTWVPDPVLGWVWVPGYTWAPSWVVFRTGPDYIGWAPVSPTFRVGVSFGFVDPSPGAFVFVSSRDFLAPRIRTCYIPESRKRVIMNRTTIVNNVRVENNVVVNHGPDVRIVERASGHKVRAERIERVPRATPGRQFRREDIRVDARREGQGLRAAEPASNRNAVAANDRRAPREEVRQRPQREEARQKPPREEVRQRPPREAARQKPPREEARQKPPHQEARPRPDASKREKAGPQAAPPKREALPPRGQVKPERRPSEQGKSASKAPQRKPVEKKKGKAQDKKGQDKQDQEKKGEGSKGEGQGSSGDRPAHERSYGNRGDF